jgi:GT2 family glycosyltransferase
MSSRSLQSRYPVSNDPQPDAPIDLTVVIVNYNVRDYLEQALRSVIRASSSLEVEIIVVDNNSVDGSLEMVREQFTAARVIANKNNVGFGAANNQALLIARGRFILILNPDTIVQEDTLETLVGFMDRQIVPTTIRGAFSDARFEQDLSAQSNLRPLQSHLFAAGRGD